MKELKSLNIKSGTLGKAALKKLFAGQTATTKTSDSGKGDPSYGGVNSGQPNGVCVCACRCSETITPDQPYTPIDIPTTVIFK